MTTPPTFPRHPSDTPGHVRTAIECSRCNVTQIVHSSVREDGSLQPDPWQAASFVGFCIEPVTGRVACSAACAACAARYPSESVYSVDASRYPNDPRINHGTPTTPGTRTIASGPTGRTTVEDRDLVIRCGHCRVATEVAQSRGPGGAWTPAPSTILIAQGWTVVGDGTAYCSQHCRLMVGGQPLDPGQRQPTTVAPVTASASAAASAEYRRRRDAGEPTRTVPTPAPAARGRAR